MTETHVPEVVGEGVKLPIQQPEQEKKKEDVLMPNVTDEINRLLPTVGTLQTTVEEQKILFAPVDPDDVEIRPDGLIYLPWPFYIRRLRDAFGTEWGLLNLGMPNVKNDILYWRFYLVIRGSLMGSMVIGEQSWSAKNRTMSFTDASEGAKSNAGMRLCKALGVAIELWTPSWVQAWKKEFSYYDEKEHKWFKKERTDTIPPWVKEQQRAKIIGVKADPQKDTGVAPAPPVISPPPPTPGVTDVPQEGYRESIADVNLIPGQPPESAKETEIPMEKVIDQVKQTFPGADIIKDHIYTQEEIEYSAHEFARLHDQMVKIERFNDLKSFWNSLPSLGTILTPEHEQMLVQFKNSLRKKLYDQVGGGK